MDRHAARLLDDEQAARLVLGDDCDRSRADRGLVTMSDVAQQVVVACVMSVWQSACSLTDHVGRIDLLALDQDRAGPYRMLLQKLDVDEADRRGRSTR